MTVELAVRADDSLRRGGVEVEEVVPARGEHRDGGSCRRPVGIGGSRRTLPVAVGPGQRRLTRALTGRWHHGVDGIVAAAGAGVWLEGRPPRRLLAGVSCRGCQAASVAGTGWWESAA